MDRGIKINCKGIKTIKKDLDLAANIPQYFAPYGPDWYQELSENQMRAADTAQASIQKDIKHKLVFNAQQLLRSIGIKPIASADQLRICLHLSRGNDIAFLWFLRQLSYQSTPKCTNGLKQPQYTVNERLLLSAIAHLDMITTLRELELVCWCQAEKPPPAECPPKPLPKRCQPPEPQRCIRVYESPYLEPLPRPLKRILHQKLAMPTLPGPNFTPYSAYSDAGHIVANESTRWFAQRCASRFDRQKILGDMFPLDLQRPPDMIAELMVAFEKATQCRCKPNYHSTGGDRRPVFPCQLDAAATKSEFIRLLEQYVTQILVGTLLKCMLMDRLPVMNYIHVCCTCKLCTQDRESLLRLTRQNGQLKVLESEYECHIRQYLFGKRKPVDVLADFNKLMCQQERCLHVCVNDHWQSEMRMWSEIDYGTGATGAAAAEMTDVNCKLAEPLRDMSSRNARFVLAGLPDVCRLPVLCEWLKVRCGHVYTRRQRAIAMCKTKKQWQKLEKDTKHMTVRPPEELEVCGHVKGLHFGHRGKIMKCVRRLRHAYHHRLNVAIINDARRFWPTMEPYLCTSGPPRKLFYAYMASCEYDIMAVHPWSVHEKKDMIMWTKKD